MLMCHIMRKLYVYLSAYVLNNCYSDKTYQIPSLINPIARNQKPVFPQQVTIHRYLPPCLSFSFSLIANVFKIELVQLNILLLW